MRSIFVAVLLAGCGPIEPDVSSGPVEALTVFEARERAHESGTERTLKPRQGLEWFFGPRQERVFAWSESELHVIDLASPEEAIVVQGLWTGVEDVLLSPNGKRIAIVFHDGVELRDVDTWELRGSIESELTDGLIVLSTGGDVVALTRWTTEVADHGTEVWRMRDGALLSKWDEGYSQLVFMPGDHRLVGTTAFWETVSARDIGNGDELWRYVGGSRECALESGITLSPRGTHFAYSACGHALFTQKVGAKSGPPIARSDGCGLRHVYVQEYAADGQTFVAGSAYWHARFDARTGYTIDRWDVEEAPWPPEDPVVSTRDGRYVIETDAIRNTLTGQVHELPYDLVQPED